MNMRERMLAVVRGEEMDRVPFAQYEGLAGSSEEIWSLVGRENMGIFRWTSCYRFESRNCWYETEELLENDRRGLKTTLHTPEGTLTETRFFEPALGSSSIRKHYVSTPEDYRCLIAYLRDTVVHPDIETIMQVDREMGDDGIPHVSVPRTPYQRLWIEWVGLEGLCLHMVDYPDLVEECVSLMGAQMTEIFEGIRNAPVPYIVFPDNITAPTIGERYFRKYCMPYYHELADMLSDRDIPIYVHMDGDLKPLWDAIAVSQVRGLDSYSPPPDNDTPVWKAAQIWPEMRLGVNFPSSVHLATPDVIYDNAMRILEEAGHTGRLQIQISENVPPGSWRKSYPMIVKAIREFGRP